MRIKIGEYVITKDKHQFILNKEYTVKEGKEAGETKLTALSYHPKLEQLCERLLEREIGDVETLSELLTSIRSTRQLIKKGLMEAL